MLVEGDELGSVIESIRRYAIAYLETHGEPLKSSFVAQRYARPIKRLTGLGVRDWLETRPEFITSISKSGALFVYARE